MGNHTRDSKDQTRVSANIQSKDFSIDSLSKLFVEDKVVVLKMNPVNEYIGPIIEDVFHSEIPTYCIFIFLH